MTIWRTFNASWIPKVTNTPTAYVIQLFHCNNGCTNAPRYYVIRTLPVLFSKEKGMETVDLKQIF
jgi:hypothetical protein